MLQNITNQTPYAAAEFHNTIHVPHMDPQNCIPAAPVTLSPAGLLQYTVGSLRYLD